MPIKFRCAYCNKLLGISRRKAGTVVRCPSCEGQVVVPNLEEAGLSGKHRRVSGPGGGGGGQMFEGNELDRMLEGAQGDQPSLLAHMPGVQQELANYPLGASLDVQRVPGGPMPQYPPPYGPQPGGFWRRKGTILTIIVILALGISFGIGLMVGISIGQKKAAAKSK